jgi:hypothetical protein
MVTKNVKCKWCKFRYPEKYMTNGYCENCTVTIETHVLEEGYTYYL